MRIQGRSIVRQALTIAVVLAAFAYTGLLRRVQQDMVQNPTVVLESLNYSKLDLSTTAKSGFLTGADISTPTKALSYLPLGASYFMIVPAPWHVGSWRQNLAIPETTIWVIFYPFAILGLIAAAKKNVPATNLFLAYFLFTLLLYGLFIGNIGTAYPLRVQLWIVLAMLIPWGWEEWRTKRKKQTSRATNHSFHLIAEHERANS